MGISIYIKSPILVIAGLTICTAVGFKLGKEYEKNARFGSNESKND